MFKLYLCCKQLFIGVDEPVAQIFSPGRQFTANQH